MSDFYKLNSMLREMVSDRRGNPLVYKRFTALLISDRKEAVINHTLKAIVAYFVESAQPIEKIFEDPNSVSSFFLNLCREYPWIICLELTHSDSRNRYQMALILRSLFSLQLDLPTINIFRELFIEEVNDIWHIFFKLFTDSEPQIRVVCIQITEVLLKTQIDEKMISNLVLNLNKRLSDILSVIRINSTLIVENCSQSENILDRNLMRSFVSRIGDIDFNVRRHALISVSEVFNIIRNKYLKTVDNYYYKLSTACLIRYTTNTREEEKALIEEIFAINLINMRTESSTKMQNLLNLICFCDKIGVQSITQVFHNQLIMRRHLAKLIKYSERHDFQLSIINSNIKLAKSLLKSFEYIDEIEELLDKFNLLLKNYSEDNTIDNDNRITDLINVFLCKTSMSSQQSIDLIQEFFDCQQSVVQIEELMELKNQVIIRTGIGLIDSTALIQLFGHINSIDCSIDPQFVIRLASFVVLLTHSYSDYFTDETVVEELLGLPQILLKYIATDSLINEIKCSQTLKQRIKNMSQSIPE